MLDLALILVVLAACGARTPPPAEPAETAALAFDIPTSARAKLSPAMAKTWGAGHLQPGTYTPIALNAYRRGIEANGYLMYAYKPSGGTWTETTIDPFADGVVHSSLLLDAANRIRIVYSAAIDDDLKYATRCF